MTAIDLLHREIADPETQWSLGTFGAIAEFSRDPDEAVLLAQSADGVSAVTARGAIALNGAARARPFASESITKSGWNQRVAFCLPEEMARLNQRTVFTELGPDHAALRPDDRESILFDLGLGAPHADFCVRIADRALAFELRMCTGRPVFACDNPAMGIILQANPHRVFVSRLGRIEVFQPIPPANGKSPDGPHTHVLPKLLASRRTHPATEPVPDGFLPCAHLYPAHPARDGSGEPQPFTAARHARFQQLLARWGDADGIAIKHRVWDAVRAGAPPSVLTANRHGRTSIRVALRQLKAGGDASPALPAWLTSFDQGNLGDSDDEIAQHHG